MSTTMTRENPDRRGRGRPYIGPSIHARVPRDVLDELDELAKKENTTRAELIREAVVELLIDARAEYETGHRGVPDE